MLSSRIVRHVLIALLACVTFGCRRADPNPFHQLARADLQSDLDQLHRIIKRHHPQTVTDRAKLESVFRQQRGRLDQGMTVAEFYRVAQPAVAAVQCSHTALELPGRARRLVAETSTWLPVDVCYLDGRLLVIGVADPVAAPPIGSEILSINGRPTATIIEQMSSCLTADAGSLSHKRWKLNEGFATYYAQFVEITNAFRLAYSADQGRTTEAQLSGVTRDVWWKTFRSSPAANGRFQLMETQVLEDGGYAVLTVRFFDYEAADNFQARLAHFFAELDEKQIKYLILDLRGNDGGDAYAGAHLLSYLVGRPFRYFSSRSTFLNRDLKKTQSPSEPVFQGQCYVLIDGGCVSTTGHVCAQLKDKTSAVFLGERTGASGLCHGGFREYTLRHSGIRVQLPHASFIAAVRDVYLYRGLQPDHEVLPTAEDLLTGRDPVSEMTQRLILAHQESMP